MRQGVGRVRLAATALGTVLWAAPAAAQIDAGYLADYRDGELRVRFDPGTRESVATLPLVLTGAPVILVFEARWPGRAPAEGPTSVEVRSHLAPQTEQSAPRPTELRLLLGSGTRDPVELFFQGSSWGKVGFTAPGQPVELVRFAMTPAELAAAAASERLSGEVMGFPFALTPSQVGYLQAFAERIGLDGGP